MVLVASCVTTSSVFAQPPQGPPDQVERRSAVLASGEVARLVVRWTPDDATSGAAVAIGEAAPTLLVRGASAGAVERGERVAIVAYETADRTAPFRYRVIRRNGASDELGPEQRLPRPGSRTDDFPFAVSIAPIPGRGFALFYEEVQSDDPSAARTYLYFLDLDGTVVGDGREIGVPWPIAASVWNGRGFHLALLYPGGGGGMRLSMVSLTPEGTPEQHPDWASSAGYVADVHLVVAAERIVAHYHGGGAGDRWLESDVTAIRSWGSDPPRATDHGPVDLDVSFAVGLDGRIVRVPSRATDEAIFASRSRR